MTTYCVGRCCGQLKMKIEDWIWDKINMLCHQGGRHEGFNGADGPLIMLFYIGLLTR